MDLALHDQQPHQASGDRTMASLLEPCREGHSLLFTPIGEALKTGFEIGVVIGKPGSSSDRNDNSAQVGQLEHSSRTL